MSYRPDRPADQPGCLSGYRLAQTARRAALANCGRPITDETFGACQEWHDHVTRCPACGSAYTKNRPKTLRRPREDWPAHDAGAP